MLVIHLRHALIVLGHRANALRLLPRVLCEAQLVVAVMVGLLVADALLLKVDLLLALGLGGLASGLALPILLALRCGLPDAIQRSGARRASPPAPKPARAAWTPATAFLAQSRAVP